MKRLILAAVLGLAAMFLALSAPHIVEYIRLGFMIRTPVAIAVLMGLYWRGANATGAASAIIIGTLSVLGWENFGNPDDVDPFWIAAPITFLVIVVGSLVTRGSREGKLATKSLIP